MTPEDILKARLAKGEIDKETYRELMAEISDQKTSNSGTETGGDGHEHQSGGSDGQITKNDRETAKPGGEDANTGLLAKIGGAILLIAVLSGFFLMRNHQEQARLERSTEDARQRLEDAGSISDLLNTDPPRQRPETVPQRATEPVSDYSNVSTQDIIGCWNIGTYQISDGPFKITMFGTEVTYNRDGTSTGSSVINVSGSDDEMFDGRYDFTITGTFNVENGDIVSRLSGVQVEPRVTSPLNAAERDIKRIFTQAFDDVGDEIQREKIASFSTNIMMTESRMDNGDVVFFSYTRTCS